MPSTDEGEAACDVHYCSEPHERRSIGKPMMLHQGDVHVGRKELHDARHHEIEAEQEPPRDDLPSGFCVVHHWFPIIL